MRSICWVVVPHLLAVAASMAHAAPDPGLRAPPGFEITEFAGSQLANDIYKISVDPQGRLVVAGRGYIRILVDDDRDGRADRAIEFADGPKDGAMGLLWEDSTLYVTGDGGLRRYRDADGDGRADGPSELIRTFKTGGEHDAHAIRRGPDGWLYVLCGNMAGVDKAYAQLPTSPIRDPVGGCVVRFSPDLKSSEIVADGFRNAYDMDFNLEGELFTYDSDNERCVSLPWYEGTRFYHVMSGGHYGWQSPQRAQWWRLPPYACDVVAPLADLGRGSPTGVACYRHMQFPEAYRGGVFFLDWTFGRVYFAALKRAGATYSCQPQVFLEAVGDNGFAPTSAVVHPETGDLFIAIGGRGTRGAVYRVRYSNGVRSFTREELATFRVPSRSLEWHPSLKQELLDKATTANALERRRALEAISRHRSHFDVDQVSSVIRSNWDHPDRYVRQAAARLINVTNEAERRALAEHIRTPGQAMTFGLGTFATEPSEVISRAARILASKDAEAESRLAGVRLMQLALGDLTSPAVKGQIWEGYTPRIDLDKSGVSKVQAALRETFPSGQQELDREIARTLAMTADDDAGSVQKAADQLTTMSDPANDVHYLTVLARLRGPKVQFTDKVATTLLNLDRKLVQRGRKQDRHWAQRVAELYAELARQNPRLHEAILTHKDFGRPEHALFAQMTGFNQRRAADVFLARSRGDPDYEWSSALVELLAYLPEEQAHPLLRRLWDNMGLRESILAVLAKSPRTEDRDKFLEGLSSPQLATIRQCLTSLEKLPPAKDGAALLPLLRCLRRLSDSREEKPIREQVGKYLQKVTGQGKLGSDPQAWTEWFTRTYPDLASRLGGQDGVDVAAWNQRLAEVDWPAGQAERGRNVYVKAGCAACHSGAQALGPDLHGVTGRFSRADLFTAIVQPSRDVSPRYQTTLISMTDGKVYQGSVIYEAVDGIILQTGPSTTVRLGGSQIAERRVTPMSLMPAGLLDSLSKQDLADLYAYLRSLGNRPRRRRGWHGLAASPSEDALAKLGKRPTRGTRRRENDVLRASLWC